MTMILIGPTLGKHPSQIGGTTKSFDALLRYLRKKNIAFKHVSTNRFRSPFASLLNAVYILCKSFMLIPFCNPVMFNASPRGALIFGPLLYLYAKLWRKHFIFRMFGGDLIEVFEAQSDHVRLLLRKTLLQSDLLFLQTRRLVDYFSQYSENIKQLPTSREAHCVSRTTHTYTKRLVFIGLICSEKGIDHILRFIEQHGDDFTVDIYGPILDPKYKTIASIPNYKGVVQSQDVINTLANYDILVLPTHYAGEGYPGVIIEAYSVGLPVISTEWLAIPELVKHDETGLLVAPDDYPAFERAILEITEASFQRMSAAAQLWSKQFSSEKVNDNMLSQIRQLQTANR